MDFGEADNDPGRSFQEGFAPVGSQRRERGQPLRWHAAVVARVFFLFGRFADALFERWVADRHKTPWLAMCSAGRRRGRQYPFLYRRARHGPFAE